MKTLKNQNLDIFNKGKFEPINDGFIKDSFIAMKPLMDIQVKYEKLDNDTFFNEIKDGIIASELGFDLINTHKHGFDAKKSDKEEYLEVKQVSFSAHSWGATFNDTNLEKADAFMDQKLFLAVGIWSGLCDLQFIIYGQHPGIGEYLKQRIINKKPESRSTQTISVSSLVRKYGFKIIPVKLQKADIEIMMKLQYKKSTNWWSEAII